MSIQSRWIYGVAVSSLLLLGVQLQADAPADIPSSECLACHAAGTGPQLPLHRSHVSGVPYGMPSRLSIRLRAANQPSGLGGTVETDLLVQGNVECTSCHVGHDVEATNRFRLRSERMTELCRGCHLLE